MGAEDRQSCRVGQEPFNQNPFQRFCNTTYRVTTANAALAMPQIVGPDNNRIALRIFNATAATVFLRPTGVPASGDYVEMSASFMDLRFSWWDDGPLCQLGWSARVATGTAAMGIFEWLWLPGR